MVGLSTQEALLLLKKYGPNAIVEEKPHAWMIFLKKFWEPIPWMLEGIIALELVLKHQEAAGVIFLLLLFNASLSFFQEKKASAAMQLLKKKLNVTVRVMRDGKWKLIPAEELVLGDYIRLRMGDFLPADAILSEGTLSIDQSLLTGESLPIEALAGQLVFAGALVIRGEAFAQVTATGSRSQFGKTAEIVRIAKAPSHLQKTIFQIIQYLVAFDLILIISVFLYSLYFHLSIVDLIPFSLLLFVASVPVALPPMFTLASALGSLDLAQSGVLVTHLSAIEETAAMSILCIDKTGTITKNSPEITEVWPISPFSKEEVLFFASLASEESTLDPIDLAIVRASQKVKQNDLSLRRKEFIPFDPEKKYSEALISDGIQTMRIRKGSASVLVKEKFAEKVHQLGADGSRVLCIEIEGKPAGFLKIQDPIREDSQHTIQEIQKLGIRVLMLTGDTFVTAQAIAEQVGIGKRVITRDQLENILQADSIAGVFPEDKYRIIDLLQKESFVVGMTGDGVNDAPALKKAEVGIAVANAVDTAKSSASLVLTTPGLSRIVDAVKTSRKIYQRMLTYTINKIIKTLEISILLGVGLMFAKEFIITPSLIVLLLFTNDLITMSIATDRVSFSRKPDRWKVKKLMGTGIFFASLILLFSFSLLLYCSKRFSLPEIQTLVFLTLCFTGQATVYLVRERRHFWHSRPSTWMLAGSFFDIVLICLFASFGIFMSPLSFSFILLLFLSISVFFFLLDFVKAKLFNRFS